MKSTKARFEAQGKKNPNNGSYVNFVNAVKGQNFTLDTVSRGFSKLVPKDEYTKKDKKHLIDQLMAHTKCTEEDSREEEVEKESGGIRLMQSIEDLEYKLSHHLSLQR